MSTWPTPAEARGAVGGQDGEGAERLVVLAGVPHIVQRRHVQHGALAQADVVRLLLAAVLRFRRCGLPQSRNILL